MVQLAGELPPMVHLSAAVVGSPNPRLLCLLHRPLHAQRGCKSIHCSITWWCNGDIMAVFSQRKGNTGWVAVVMRRHWRRQPKSLMLQKRRSNWKEVWIVYAQFFINYEVVKSGLLFLNNYRWRCAGHMVLLWSTTILHLWMARSCRFYVCMPL